MTNGIAALNNALYLVSSSSSQRYLLSQLRRIPSQACWTDCGSVAAKQSQTCWREGGSASVRFTDTSQQKAPPRGMQAPLGRMQPRWGCMLLFVLVLLAEQMYTYGQVICTQKHVCVDPHVWIAHTWDK